MKLFRALLVLQILTIFSYTVLVGLNHGWNLFHVFFGDILKANWPGQFNLDFSLMLMLSALWTSWRNRFSFPGLILGFFALIGGISFLAPYLLFLTFKTNGNTKEILLGSHSE